MLRPFLFGLCTIGALSACDAPQQALETARNDMVLETYTVPEGYSGQLENALGRVLYTQKEQPSNGRVIAGPNGQIVVVAPESIQTGVRSLVDQLQAELPAASAPSNVRINYWLVRGKHAEEASPPQLDPAIDGALQAIYDAEGPLEFSLRARKSLMSMDGDRANISGGELQISQTASVDAGTGTILADLEIEASRGVGIETRIQVSSGQVVVLGEAGDFGNGKAYDTLFYIVQPQIRTAD